MVAYAIRPVTLADAAGYHRCIDSVARERKFLKMVRANSLEASERWIRLLLVGRYPFFVVERGDEIVGWCDIGPREGEGFRHTAGVGMGLREDMRGRGVGTALLRRMLDAVESMASIEKLELDVYGSNVAARRLYERHGFEVEGVRRRARKLDGAYDDILLMSRFFERRSTA